jgi:hypothetical protein
MAAPVAKIYAAAPVVIGMGKLYAVICDPDWKACMICSAMIDQDRWAELAEHVTAQWVRQDQDRGVFLNLEERTRLKRTIELTHAAIRDALGRTA